MAAGVVIATEVPAAGGTVVGIPCQGIPGHQIGLIATEGLIAIQGGADFGGTQAAVPNAQITDGTFPVVGLVGAVADAVIAPDAQPRAGDGIAELAGAHVHPIDIEGAVGGAAAALDQGVLVPATIGRHASCDGPEVADAQITVAGFFD